MTETTEAIATKVLVIGSGPAGCTAAIYAARAGLAPVMAHGLQPGGQLTITTDVENYPGFAETIQGPWLMAQMEAQAAHVGTRIIADIITEIDLSRRPFTARGDSGAQYLAQSIIIATGASARWLGLESEQAFQGFGVSACATCDGFFYRNREVCVIGGGNTAAEEALFLTGFASRVWLIHRRDKLRAEHILADRALAHDKIEPVWDHVLDEVLGDSDPPGVTGVRLKHVQTGATREISLHGVFVAIGHDPNTGLFRGSLDMDDEGYILTRPGSTATNIPGVFASGDVQDKIFRQAVTAAGSGCMAALEAGKFLAESEAAAAAD